MNKAHIYTQSYVKCKSVCSGAFLCCVYLAGPIARKPLSYQLKLNSNSTITSNNNNNYNKIERTIEEEGSYYLFLLLSSLPFIDLFFSLRNITYKYNQQKKEFNERKKRKTKYVYSIAIKTN